MLGRQGFGGLLSDEQWSQFLKSGSTRKYSDGEMIIHQGDRDRTVFLLVEGTVKVSMVHPDGAEVLLAVRGPGESLGELAALSGLSRTATVTALGGPCLTRVLTSEQFRLLARSMGLEGVLWQHVVSRQSESDSLRAEMMALPSGQRLAATLLRLVDLVGGDIDSATFPSGENGRRGAMLRLGLSQEELGKSVGLSRTAMATGFTKLRSLNVVRTGRQYISILDVDRLRQLAAGTE
ncbi:Crp/Fnr family transcriptional regulator [Salinactinospora qingdaonensis]|uniref:cAMP-binding domain of CRP or a regulatory subunit of cAMP-dependent protein kinases n=1 Tax=Salinactinospora qingdaonensis TaxID=702744 RepID=A0ABP7G2D4_9ACTN